MAGPALVIGVGKPKAGAMAEGSPDEEAAESPDQENAEGDPEDMHLDDAFEALQTGDKEGFREAMKKCLLASDSGGYTGPGGEAEG